MSGNTHSLDGRFLQLNCSRCSAEHLELFVNYEEYHPFGSTAYLQMDGVIRAAAKRYRFTGKERGEKTALDYGKILLQFSN